jgi:hypothetical protein
LNPLPLGEDNNPYTNGNVMSEERVKYYLPFAALIVAILVGAFYLSPIVSSVAITCLSALYGMNVYLDKSKRMKEIEDIVNKQNEVIHKMAEEVQAVRTSMAGFKLSQNMQTTFGSSSAKVLRG